MEVKVYGVLLVALLAVTAARAAQYLSEKPPFLTPCHQKDPNFYKCFNANFQTVFTQWKDGVPGLKSLGPFDPLHVKRVRIDQNQNSQVIAVKIDLKDVQIRGASGAVLKETRLDINKRHIVFKGIIPKLRFDGDYRVKGRVLSLALNGNGKARFEAENVAIMVVMNFNIKDIDHFSFTDIQTLKVEIQDISKFHLNLHNLFGGQKELEESANALFNENWREFFEVLRPAIHETVTAVLFDRFKKIFNFVPANYFIADFPKANTVSG